MMKHDETCQWTILSAMIFATTLHESSMYTSNAVEATNLEGAVEATHGYKPVIKVISLNPYKLGFNP